MKKNIDNLKINISEKLELPMDISLDLPRIIIIGNKELNIINHKGIIQYTVHTIRINSKIGVIKITGESMEIKNILSDEIVITGIVENVEIIS